MTKSLLLLSLALSLQTAGTAMAADATRFDFDRSWDPYSYKSRNQYSPFSPEVQKIIEQVAREYEANESVAEQANRKMVVVTATPEKKFQPLTVFGFTEKDVLTADGDPQGAACSHKHDQGDMSNRWCHAQIVKLADSYMRSKGLNKELSAIFSASIFVPKEYLYDLHPSMSDLVMAEYEIFSHTKQQKTTRMTVTAFADKAVFFTFQKQFN